MIRELTQDDLTDASEIGKQFFIESSIPGKIVPEIFVKNWTFLIANGMGKIFGLYQNDKMVGAVGGIIAPDLNDGDLCATEAFWFIKAESRGGGVKLLLYFLNYAKEIGCVRVNMVHLFNLHADKVSKLYLRMGFKPMEIHYSLTL